MSRVAVFGASGFVGATLVERLLTNGHYSVRPLIHSTASAWRLARHGIELRAVELLSPRDVRAALEGCTHVVNCSRGPRAVMLKGLQNLLDASREVGVQRFVHLSSVAVYGDPPPSESVNEDAPTRPIPDSYGWTKLMQDQMVQVACRRGLPSVVLCPPYIAGAYSNVVLRLLGAIQDGRFALVDAGDMPVNLIDVQNLAQAIELALSCSQADGRRIFVTNDEATTWRHVADALLPLAERGIAVASIQGDDARRLSRSDPSPQPSVLRSLKRLAASSEVRDILRDDPLVRGVYHFTQKISGLISPGISDRLRAWVKPPSKIAQKKEPMRYDKQILGLQLRGIRHACVRARAVLGYAPELSFAESMEAFAGWYRYSHGWGSDYATLFTELNRGAHVSRSEADEV